MKIITTIVTVLLALFATACGADKPVPPPPPPAPTSTPSIPSAATPSSAASQSTSAATGTAKLGEQRTLSDTDESGEDVTVAAQVVSYRQPVRIRYSDPHDFQGSQFAVADVRVCIVKSGEGKVLVSPESWLLEYSDGTSVEWSGLTGAIEREYPADKSLRTGRCARGRVIFAVPRGGKPERIVYSPGGADAESTLEWGLS